METELHERLEKIAYEKYPKYEKMYPKYKVLFIETLEAAYLMDREEDRAIILYLIEAASMALSYLGDTKNYSEGEEVLAHHLRYALQKALTNPL